MSFLKIDTLVRFVCALLFERHIKRRIKKSPDYLYFIAASGLGDVCYAFAFLSALKEDRRKKIYVYATPYLKELTSYYPQIDCVSIMKPWMVKGAKAFHRWGIDQRFYRMKETEVFTCDQWWLYPMSIMRVPTLSFFDILKFAYYKLSSSDAPISYPVVKTENKDCFGGIDIKRSVLINPYSNSQKAKNTLFESIVDALTKSGYEVYTNVSSDYEQPLAGTKPLKISLMELYYYASNCAFVISIRSGLLDFLANSGGRFLAIYSNEAKKEFRIAYNLSEWKGRSSFKEFNSDQQDEIIHYLLSVI